MAEFTSLIQKYVMQIYTCIQRSDKAINVKAAEDLLNCIEQAFTNYAVKDNFKASLCSHIFGENYGLLEFLKAIVIRDKEKEELKNLKLTIFRFLDNFIDIVGTSIITYGPVLKDICILYMKREATAIVKHQAVVTLSKILEVCQRESDSMNAKQIIEDLYSQLSRGYKLASTVKEVILNVLGVIAHFYPQEFIPYSDRMLTIFLQELKQQMSSTNTKVEQTVIVGCLLGLKEYMYNFTVSYEEDMDKSYQIYDCVRKAIIQPDTGLYIIKRAALQLLSAHASQLGMFLYESYDKLYPAISQAIISHNAEVRKVAFLAAIAFLKQVAEILPEKIQEDKRSTISIFNFFINNFKDTFARTSSQKKEVNIAAIGYGLFASACKLLVDDAEVKKMLFNIIQRSEHMFFSDTIKLEETIVILPSFLEALANIISQTDYISEGTLFSVEKLVVFQIENFPIVSSAHQFLVTQALTKVLLSIQPKVDIFKGFLQRIVYQGLARTFSHPIVADVEAGKNLKNEEFVVNNPRVKIYTYKNYLFLWSTVLKVVQLKEFNAIGIPLVERQSLKEALYDEIISCIISLYKKLDLSANNNNLENVDDQGDNNPSSDLLHGLKPSNLNDCHIFINLVDFCRKFLIDNCVELFDKWVYTFGRETIHYSTKYPFISGFYKLVALNLNICSEIDYFKDFSAGEEDSDSFIASSRRKECENSFHLFSKFSREVVAHLQQFKDDLLASCLLVILALPTQIIEKELPILIPALQNTLKLGVTYLPLAVLGLKTLKRWSTEVSHDSMQKYYPIILPLLNQYLVTPEQKDDKESKEVTKTSKALSKKVHKVSTKYVKVPTKVTPEIAEESELMKIQLEIIEFLGSLGGKHNKMMLDQASEKAEAAAIAWDFDNRQHLKYAVPFVDMKPDIYFDDFLPRVLELATTSGDRRIKVASCEVLHSLVLYIVGKGSQTPVDLLHRKTSMEELYKHLFPGLLELACDVDQVAKQLFQPLVLQLTHWFTHRRTIGTPESHVILLSLWDGVTHPDNAALRDFSALCIKEYFVWTIKQSGDTRRFTKDDNEENKIKRSKTDNIFSKMFSFALHPSPYKRLGAALVFNNLYKEFRNEVNLVKQFTLHILVRFVESLAIAHSDDKFLGTHKLCVEALDHVERILVVKAECFLSPDSNCDKPICLENTDIKSVVSWLFDQCGCIQTECRQKCMELVVKFAPLIPGVNNISDFLKMFEKNRNIVSSVFEHRLCELGIPPVSIHWKSSIVWMEALICSLECYTWALMEDMFLNEDEQLSQECRIFEACEFFLQEVLKAHDEKSTLLFKVLNSAESLSSKDLVDFNQMKCTVIIRIFGFLMTLENKPSSFCGQKQLTLWSSNLQDVLILTVVDAKCLGFDTTDLYVASNLHEELSKILQMQKCQEQSFKTKCNQYLSSRDKYKLMNYFPVNFDNLDTDFVLLNELISGYKLLSGAQLWPLGTQTVPEAQKDVELMLNNVWDSFPDPSASSKINAATNPVAYHCVISIIGLCESLSIKDEYLVSKLLGSNNASDVDAAKKAINIYTCYEEQISEVLCKSVASLFPVLLSRLSTHSSQVIAIIAKFMNCVSTSKFLHKMYGGIVLDVFLRSWKILHSWWEGHCPNDAMDSSSSVLTNMLLLKPKAGVENSLLFDTYFMLLNSHKTALDFKVRNFDLLPFFLEAENQATILCDCIDRLIVNSFPISCKELTVGSSLYNIYTSAIKKLLSALDLTSNTLLLKLMTVHFCKEENHFMQEKFEHCLVSLIKRLPPDKHQELAEVTFSLTRSDSNLSPNVQFTIMDCTCLVILGRISLSAFTNFFVKNIKYVMGILQERKTYKVEAKAAQLISKIGAFKLIDLLYTRLSKHQLHSSESQVVNAYVGHLHMHDPEAGKELTKDITKIAFEFKKENIDTDDAFAELSRILCCASFNCLIAVVTCTQKELKFYNGLIFKENAAKGERIWQSLVDPMKNYDFNLEMDEAANRKKQFVSIRHSVRNNNNNTEGQMEVESSFHMMASQQLAMSSLASDVSKFDFSTSQQSLSSQKGVNHELDENSVSVIDTVEMEVDDLNQHECIVSMSFLIQRMHQNGLITEDSDSCPSWLQTFVNNFCDSSVHKNAKLLLARIIINNATILKVYGKFLLKPMMDLIATGSLDTTLNYFILDVVLTILSWAPEVVPEDNPIQRHNASCVLEFLIRNCAHSRRDIFRNNLEIIKTVLECWKDHFDVPYNAIYEMMRNKDPQVKENVAGIQLLGVVLSNNLPPYPVGMDAHSLPQLSLLPVNLRNKYKDVYASASEVIGLVLQYKVNMKCNLNDDSFYQKVTEKLSNMRSDETDKFLTCLHTIHRHCPQIAPRFKSKLFYIQPSVHGMYQTYVMDLLCVCVDVDDTYAQLKSIGIFQDIEHKPEDIQYILLQALKKLCQTISSDEILHFLPDIVCVCSQPATNCRLALFEILMVLYDKFRTNDGAKEKEITRISQETLLKALADSDLTVQLTVHNFWSSEERLPTSTKERLLALIENMYSPPTEDSFLQSVTFLLLERTSHSPDYKRKVFEQPLSECNFLAYNISTSWRQRFAAMTPLFVDSMSNTLSSTTLDITNMSSFRNDDQIMATQQGGGDFSATVDPTMRTSTFNWLTEKSVDTSQDFGSSATLSAGVHSPSKSHLLASKRSYNPVTTKRNLNGIGNIPKPSDKEKSRISLLRRRFIKDRSSQSDVFARRELKKRDMRVELRKEQKKQREAQVTMYRKYRIGELPDIEIPNSAIIVPIQALAQSDALIAKMLFKSLVVSICQYVEEEMGHDYTNYTEEVCQSLCQVLKKSTCFVPAVTSFCLETLHHLKCPSVDPEDIFVSSLRGNQQSLGILLLESKILKSQESVEEPQRKKVKRPQVATPQVTTQWIKLAGLHKSVYDYDVCNGIFSHVMSAEKLNQKALQFEASGQYGEALKLYSDLYEKASEDYDQAEKDFLDNSLLFCYDRLTNWEVLEETTVSRFTDLDQPDLQKIWEDQYFIDNYMPHVIRSKVKCLIEGSNKQSLLDFVDSCFEDEDKKAYLEDHYAEELALLFIIQEKYDAAKYYSLLCCSKFLKDWKNLSSLAIGVQQSKLQCLQKYIEVKEFLDLMEKKKFKNSNIVQGIIATWEKRIPCSMDPPDIWHDVVANRRLYLKKIENHCKGMHSISRTSDNDSMSMDEDANEGVSNVCMESKIKLKLSFVNYCTIHDNVPVALLHLRDILKDVKKHDGLLWPEFIGAYCFANHQKAQKLVGQTKLETFLDSMSRLSKVEDRRSLTLPQKILQSETLESMADVFANSEVYFSDLTTENRKKIANIVHGDSSEEIHRNLHVKSFEYLKDAVSNINEYEVKVTEKSKGDAFLSLANFCNKYLRLKEAEGEDFSGDAVSLYSSYPNVLVKSLLSALRCGNKQAMQLFPRLLQLIELYPEVTQFFIENVSNIPCWMFLQWINQLVALLDKPESVAVQEIVKNITETYPNAIIYAFRLSNDSYSFSNDSTGRKNKAFVARIKFILSRNNLIEDFISALNHLSVPYIIFKDYVSEFSRLMKAEGNAEKLQDLYDDMWHKMFDAKSQEFKLLKSNGPMQKKFAKDFASDIIGAFGENGKKLFSENPSDVIKKMRELCGKMRSDFLVRKKKFSLSTLSDWLADFQSWKYDTQIEIPGQYAGKSKPMPEYHVKVAGFDEKVLVLSSITQPCRIVIRGNDEKEYKILVKAGEDLRQDNRIQQLFSLMNEIYADDLNCGKRRLKLATYKVIPLSSKCGLIEWVDNTVVLNEFLMNSMTDSESNKFKSRSGFNNIFHEKIFNWSGIPKKEVNNQVLIYNTLHKKKTREDSIRKFDEFVNATPDGLLKRAFLKLSSSPEAFIRLRSEFAASHAVICISQWLLGIGDRHLGNFLIDMRTGKEVGIDFGHAFGSATQFLPVPEFIPFRLTPQYLQLMSPLKEKGIIEATMIHALSALRRNHNLLLNIMDIFIKEPTVDWKAKAYDQQQALGLTSEEAEADANWYPKQRVKMAQDKLHGINPCQVTLKELELGHSTTNTSFHKFQSLCLGDKEHNIRAQLPSSQLTVEQQVSCLLDQATDPHILCKTYFGWNPWL